MKRIINGKRYDTKTANEVANESEGYGGDFHRWNESLYITANGSWFIAGDGGALSRWAESTGNGNERSGGCGIRPLTSDEALEWLERYERTCEIEEYFSRVVKDA